MADAAPLSDDDRAELVAYLDGELDDEARRRVEQQISLNPRARAEAESLKRTWELLDYLPQTEPSASLTTRTLDAVAALKPTVRGMSRWVRAAGWAAAVLMAGTAGFVATGNRPHPPAPPDLEADPVYVADPRVIDHLPLYLAADHLEFLLALDNPDLFGEDGPGH